MAYIAPSDVITGQLITAPKWNQDVVENMKQVYSLANTALLSVPDPRAYIKVGPNDSTENTVATWTIPADGMGTTGFFYGLCRARAFNNASGGVARICTIRLKLGVTTLLTLDNTNIQFNATEYTPFEVRFSVGNANSDSSQVCVGIMEVGDHSASGADRPMQAGCGGTGVAAEDTTGDLAFIVTAQLAVSGDFWIEFTTLKLSGPFDPS